MKLKLSKPICIPDNIVVEYRSFKNKPKSVGFMQPMTDDGMNGAVVFIDSRMTPDQKRRIAVHEALHIAYPDLNETQVVIGSRVIAKVIKLAGFDLRKKKVR